MSIYQYRTTPSPDFAALEGLEAACFAIGEIEYIPVPTYRELIASPNARLMVVTADDLPDQIVGVAWVQLNGDQARLGGKVHPAHRRQKIGTALLRWCEEEVYQLGQPSSLIIRHEAFNEGSKALYTQQGFRCDFIEQRMRRDLSDPLPVIAQHFDQVTWTAETAPQFFEAYHDAFKERPGFPNTSAEEWIQDNSDEGGFHFRPDLSLLALDQGVPIGFVSTYLQEIAPLKQTVGWVAQIGTRPAWRGRGVAAGLITTVLDSFKREGISFVDLDVNLNNPRALYVYEKLGFKMIGLRAKYSKKID